MTLHKDFPDKCVALENLAKIWVVLCIEKTFAKFEVHQYRSQVVIFHKKKQIPVIIFLWNATSTYRLHCHFRTEDFDEGMWCQANTILFIEYLQGAELQNVRMSVVKARTWRNELPHKNLVLKKSAPPFPQLQKISIEATLYFLMPRVGWLEIRKDLALAIYIGNSVVFGSITKWLSTKSYFIIYQVHPIYYSQCRSVYSTF